MFEELNPDYFAENQSWTERLDAKLDKLGEGFVKANFDSIQKVSQDKNTGPRMVVNIPADALLSFLESGEYLNAYQKPIVGDEPPDGPSPTRLRVDQWLDLGCPEHHYFGAVGLGGTGVRFYGEYCMVLRPDAIEDDTRVFDRNSYDLARPPFADLSDADHAAIVAMLRGTWSQDLLSMVMMKLLHTIDGANWLVTLGTISDTVLHDEEFIEVHRHGSFEPEDLEEIRLAPEDETISLQIERQYELGILPLPEEMLWRARRTLVASVLARKRGNPPARIPTRVVVSSGRGSRWR